MPENMEEIAACDTLSWPLPLYGKDALQLHGTSARLASTGCPTGRSPTHLTTHKARADGHQIILGHGRGGVLVAGTNHVLSRNARAGRGASNDLLVLEACSSQLASLSSLPSTWSLPTRDASHSTSSLAPVSRPGRAYEAGGGDCWRGRVGVGLSDARGVELVEGRRYKDETPRDCVWSVAGCLRQAKVVYVHRERHKCRTKKNPKRDKKKPFVVIELLLHVTKHKAIHSRYATQCPWWWWSSCQTRYFGQGRGLYPAAC